MTMCVPPARHASGCVLLLSVLLAAAPASGQTQNNTINTADPTLRQAMPSSRLPDIPMNTGMGYDLTSGIGSVDYAGMENSASKVDFTGAAYYQAGLNSMLAGVLRGELSLDLGASDMGAEGASDLEEVDGFAARAFAEINVNDILSVGYGVMGASMSGSTVGGTEYGGDGFLLADAVRGTLSIITDGPGLRVAAYRTLNAATAFEEDEQHYDEQLYRFGATWGSQGDIELGYEIRDVQYVADAGRDISGLSNSIYLQFYLRP